MKLWKTKCRQFVLLSSPVVLLALLASFRRDSLAPVDIQMAPWPWSSVSVPVTEEFQQLSSTLRQYPQRTIFRVYWKRILLTRYNRKTRKLWGFNSGSKKECWYDSFQNIGDEQIHFMARFGDPFKALKSLGFIQVKYISPVGCSTDSPDVQPEFD